MTTIKNYTISDFFNKPIELVESYLIYLEELKPNNKITYDGVVISKGQLKEVAKTKVCKSLWFLPWDDVQELKQLIAGKENPPFEDVTKAFQLIFSISEREAGTIRIVDFYAAMKFIRDEVINIIKVEEQNFAFDPEPKMATALELYKKELEAIGTVIAIDNLSGGDMTKWETIRKMPYGYVHRKQWKNNVYAKIDKIVNKPKKTA